MKRVILCALVAFCFTFSSAQKPVPAKGKPHPYTWEDDIKKALQEVIAGLPDPIKLDTWRVDLPTDSLITGSLEISDLVLTGLKSIGIPYIKINLFPISLSITLELPLILKTKYNLDIFVDVGNGTPLFGNGDINIELKKLLVNANLDIQIQTKDPKVQISNVVLDISLEDLGFTITGFLGDDDLSSELSEYVRTTILQIIEDKDIIKTISDTIGPIIKDIINNILNPSEKELSQILRDLVKK